LSACFADVIITAALVISLVCQNSCHFDKSQPKY
jgi:hypothetical protein